MNPLLQAALASILRHLLTGAAMWLVARGYWTPEEASTYVAAAVLAILGFGWAIYQKHRTNVQIKTALSMKAGSTLSDLKYETKNQ